MISTENFEKKFIKNVIDASEDTIFVFDPQTGKAIVWNKAFRNISGYNDDEIQSLKAPDSYYSVEDLKKAESASMEVLESGRTTLEMTLITKDGRKIPYEYSGTTLQGSDGNMLIVSVGRNISERKEIERKLRESEEIFRTMTEQSFLGIAILQNNIVKYVNKQLANTFGYTEEEILNWGDSGFINAIHPEDRELVVEQAQKKQMGELDAVNQYQFRGIKKNGDRIWLDIFSKTINFKGKMADFVTIHDITDKKIAEQKLKDSEEKYRSLFENMTAGFAYHEVIVDENNKPIDYLYHEVNPAFEKLTGLNKENLIGKKVTEAIPGTDNDPADWIGRFGNVGLTGVPLTVEDYSEAIKRWFKVSGYSPKKGFFAVTFTDITEIKLAEQKIKESEEKYRKLFNNVPFAIVLFSIGGTIIDCNDMTDIITGYSKNELIGKNFKNFNFYVDMKSANLEERVFQVRSGKNPESREILLYKKDGSEFWARSQLEFIHIGEDTYVQAIIQDITEQNKIAQKLKESEFKFRSIFEAIPDLYFLLSEDSTIIEYRGKEQELYVKPEDFMGKKMVDVLPPELGQQILEIVKKTIMTKQAHILEYELSIRNEIHFYEGRFFYLPKNRISYFIRDITEKKKIEKENSDLAKFPSENPNPVLRVNKQMIFYINKAGRDLLNVTEGDKNPVLLQEAIIKAFNDNAPQIIEVKVNGAIYSFNIAPIEQERYVNIYGQDITERKKSESALNIEKKFTEDIINSSQDTIFVFDPETGKALRWNKEFKEVSGYSNSEISLMKAPDSYYNKEDLKISDEAIQELMVEGKTTLEMSLITKDGRKIPYEYKATTLKEPGGKISIVSIGRDMVERNLAEEKLRESEQKYRNAYDMANFYKDLFTHDMNNILQIINSSAEIISYQLGDSEKSIFIENMTNMIKNQIDRGAKLISDVRTLTSLDEEEITIFRMNISDFLKESTKFVKKAYAQRKISITQETLDEEYYTNANELLQDVFDNILINATKYNENEVVEIDIEISKHIIDEKNFIQIEFIDNGIGITDRRKELIFQPGYRELKGSKGMGIGLSLVSKIMDIFMGKIWVEDKVQGDHTQGSKFIVLLPEAN